MEEPTPHSKLNEQDQARVNEYLSSPIHQVQRPAFRPLYFTLLSIGSVSFLLGLAVLVVKLTGIET